MMNLRYIWHRCKSPQSADFIDMGLGIEARHQRCGRFWQPHLRCSKEFQQRILGFANQQDRLLILGAGRLFDTDLTVLSKNFAGIKLIDADPSCLPFWRTVKTRCSLEFQICDLTEVIGQWTAELETFLKTEHQKSKQRLAEFLFELKNAELSINRIGSLQKFEVVLSLNLLSQIPLFWRDRFAKLVLKYWGIDSNQDGEFEEPLASALLHSMARLEEDHLKLLSECSSKVVAIITDQYFHYYKSNVAEWRSEPALYSIPYSTRGAEITVPGFNLKFRESWLWHLAPQGIENKEYGEIHEVLAGAHLKV